MALKSRNLTIILSFSAALIISSSFLYLMSFRPGEGNIEIETKAGKFKIQLADNKVNLKDLLNNLLTDNNYRDDTLAILQNSFNLFKRDCSQLIDSFRREDGKSSLSKNIRELLFDLKGPFERSFHKYYDITEESVVSAINDLNYNHSVAVRFRELRDKSTGIFEDRGIEVDVSLDTSDEIKDGYAAVCKGSKFHGRNLLLLGLNNGHKSTKVFAEKTFPCINPEARQTQIQINQNNGKKLYDDINFDNKRKALLFLLPIGYDVAPHYLAQNIDIK